MPECRPPNFCLRSDCYRLSLFLSRSPRGCTWVCTWKSDLCIVCEFSHCRTCEDCDLNPSNSTKSKLFTWQRLKRPPDVPPPFISFPESQWLPPSCPWFHLSTPYTPFFPSLSPSHWTVKRHRFTECLFPDPCNWYEMYLYGKIYMQYVRMLWVKQAYADLLPLSFFVNDQACELQFEDEQIAFKWSTFKNASMTDCLYFATEVTVTTLDRCIDTLPSHATSTGNVTESPCSLVEIYRFPLSIFLFHVV